MMITCSIVKEQLVLTNYHHYILLWSPVRAFINIFKLSDYEKINNTSSVVFS